MRLKRFSFGIKTGIGIFTILLLTLFGIYMVAAEKTILGIIFLVLGFIRLLTLGKTLTYRFLNKRDKKQLEHLEHLKREHHAQ